MRKQFVTAVVLAGMVVLTTQSVEAKSAKQTGCPMAERHGGMYAKDDGKMDMDDKIFKKIHMIFAYEEEIGLSGDQKEEILNQKYTLKKGLIKNKAEIKIKALDIKRGLMSGAIDVAAVNKLIDEKYELKKQKAKNLVAAYIDLKDVLTDSQMNKLKDVCGKHMRGKMKGMMGKGRGRDKGHMMGRMKDDE